MWISNFHPALVPPPETISESDVEDYFQDMPNDTSDEIVMRIIKNYYCTQNLNFIRQITQW